MPLLNLSHSQPPPVMVLMKKTVIQLEDDTPTADRFLNGNLPDSHSKSSVTIRVQCTTHQAIPLS